MRKKLPLRAALFAAVAAMALVGAGVALAAEFDSGTNPGATGAQTIVWTGNGATNGVVDSIQCPSPDTVPDGIDPNSYLHWIVTTDGGSAGDTATLHLSGSGSGDYPATKASGGALHFFTPYFTPDSSLIAKADLNVITTGGGPWNLNISHGCTGTKPPADDLTVSKDANGTFDDTYKWKITKDVDQTKVFTAGGDPATVNYTVKVSHGDSQDSNHKVSGTITVTNPNKDGSDNPVPVDITGVTDALSDGTTCTVTDGGAQTIKGSTATFDYSCDLAGAPADGLYNTAKVSWGAQDLANGHTLAAGSAKFDTDPIKFTANEIDTCVKVVDDNGTPKDTSDDVTLGTPCVGDDGEVDHSFTFKYSGKVNALAGSCADTTNTASFTTNDNGASDSASQTVTDCQGADLTVSKTAAGTYDRECSWKIKKSASPASQTVDVGADAKVYYEVDLNATCDTTKNIAVSGKITITNPNDWEDITLTSLDDVLDSSGACTVDAGPYTVKASDSLTVGYTCASASLNDTLNTATARWDAAKYSTPTGEASGTAKVAFTETLIDDCVTVTDSLDGADPVSIGDGTYCVKRDDSGALVGTSVMIKYSRTFKGPAAGTCATHNNKASFKDNSTPQQSGSATASAKVCSYNALTPGYWKNHAANSKSGGPNYSADCTKLKSSSCSTNGPWAIAKLPQSLGNYSVSSILLADPIWAGMNCSSSKDQDAVGCLAGHLLAAKLNVATFGGSCILATITSADAFLVSINYQGPGKTYTLSPAQRTQVINLKNALDKYNNGGGC
jgi:hypothetical protein